MGDDRYCYVHAYDIPAWGDWDDMNEFDFSLPEEDVDYPAKLVPPFQNEQDDAVWPMNTHPSYPFGNPYAPTQAAVLPGAQALAGRWNEHALEDLLPFGSGPEAPGVTNGLVEASANDHHPSTSPEAEESEMYDDDEIEEDEDEEDFTG